jgi:hypothetical protein
MTTVDAPASESLSHTYYAATFMAERGEYELALRLLRKALEIAHLESRVGRPADAARDADLEDLERRLFARYAECRLKLDDEARPLRQTLAKTAIVTGGIALTFILCFAFAMSRLDALIAAPVDKVVAVLQGAVNTQVPRMTDKVLETVPVVSARLDKEAQNVSMRFSEYLEKKVDTALDQRIREIVDERLRARATGK